MLLFISGSALQQLLSELRPELSGAVLQLNNSLVEEAGYNSGVGGSA